MKIIFGVGGFGEPYKIEISDDLLYEARSAQRLLRMLPWNGEMFLPCSVTPLSDMLTYSEDTVEIVVGKKYAYLKIDNFLGRESLLDPSDDLFTIPDIYVSKDFENSLFGNMFDLNEGDIKFIETWKQLHAEKLEKS